MINVAEYFPQWKEDILHGQPPKLFSCGDSEWAPLEHGPGLMTLIGGAPGSGKTALITQAVVDGLRMNADLRVFVANCEMTLGVLLERQLSRISGVSLNCVRFRRLDANYAPLSLALDELGRIAPRLAFHDGLMTLKAVAESADAHRADWIVIDYIQRFRRDGTGDKEQRAEIDSMMETLRGFCLKGRAVTVVSAVSRQRGKGGSSYSGINLASFKGSGELEFAVDSAWTLERHENNPELIAFECVKNRHGSTPTLTLRFDGARQAFSVDPEQRAGTVMRPFGTVMEGDDDEPF